MPTAFTLARLRKHRPDPLTSVVLTVPVFLVYHLGILLIDLRNGVDLITEFTLRLLEQSVAAYVVVTLAAAAALSLTAHVQRRRGRLRPTALGPVLLESLGWAVVMLVAVGWAVAQMSSALALGGLSVGGAGLGPLDKVVMAAGAGFHEEVVFRVALLGGGIALLLRRGRVGQVPAVATAMFGTALLFALIHHLGPHGDPLSLSVLAFRFLAGLFLGAVYMLRGFAIVVYTHTLYDILVFFVFG